MIVQVNSASIRVKTTLQQVVRYGARAGLALEGKKDPVERTPLVLHATTACTNRAICPSPNVYRGPNARKDMVKKREQKYTTLLALRVVWVFFKCRTTAARHALPGYDVQQAVAMTSVQAVQRQMLFACRAQMGSTNKKTLRPWPAESFPPATGVRVRLLEQRHTTRSALNAQQAFTSQKRVRNPVVFRGLDVPQEVGTRPLVQRWRTQLVLFASQASTNPTKRAKQFVWIVRQGDMAR